MRATRRNMELMATTYDTVMVPDDSDGWEEYSATSGDYWQNGMDDDLGAELMVKRTMWLEPEELPAWLAFLDSVQQARDARDIAGQVES